MDDQLKRKITEYVSKAYAAKLHTSTQLTAEKIAATTAQLASQGVILSGRTVYEIAKIQGEHINTVVQAKADALLDAHEVYGAEIGDEILKEVKSLRAGLVQHIASSKDSGLPPGVPALNMFQSLLQTNTGSVVNSIACQIEQRKVAPKLKRQTTTSKHVIETIFESPYFWGIITLAAVAFSFEPRENNLGVWVCLLVALFTATAGLWFHPHVRANRMRLVITLVGTAIAASLLIEWGLWLTRARNASSVPTAEENRRVK